MMVSALRWYNWQFDITCESTGVFAPQSEADLSSIVKQQHEEKSFLKVVGNGHGFGNLTTCVNNGSTSRKSYIISMTNFHQVSFSDDNSTVTLGAGWDLVDVVPLLLEHGVQLLQLGSEMVQNIVGVFSTGTHGTGKDLGNIASTVVGFKVMTATGDIYEVNEKTNTEELKAFRIGLGALGIITEITVKVETIVHLKRTTRVIPTSSNLTQIFVDVKELYENSERLSVFGPFQNWNAEKLDWVMKPNMTIVTWEKSDITNVFNCSEDFCANRCGDCNIDSICYDRAQGAIAVPPAGVCDREFMAQFEHFFPVEHLLEVPVEYMEYQLNQTASMLPYNNEKVEFEMRFVKGDDAYLSPAHNYDLSVNASGVFAVFEATWFATYNDYDSLWLYQDLAAEFIPEFGETYNVRPHWNKMIFFDGEYANKTYPQLSKWLAVQERNDPDCQFVNEFLVTRLGIDRCAKYLDA